SHAHAVDAVCRRCALCQPRIGTRRRLVRNRHRRCGRVPKGSVAERVLTLKELNRATLARQLLLERKKIGVLPAIERLAGMQAQWPPSPYIGLWSRIIGFRRGMLERAIPAREVVKATLGGGQ